MRLWLLPALLGVAFATTPTPTAPAPALAAPAATPPNAVGGVIVSTDLRDGYVAGFPILVNVTVKNPTATPIVFPDLAVRPLKEALHSRYALISPESVPVSSLARAFCEELRSVILAVG